MYIYVVYFFQFENLLKIAIVKEATCRLWKIIYNQIIILDTINT